MFLALQKSTKISLPQENKKKENKINQLMVEQVWFAILLFVFVYFNASEMFKCYRFISKITFIQ